MTSIKILSTLDIIQQQINELYRLADQLSLDKTPQLPPKQLKSILKKSQPVQEEEEDEEGEERVEEEEENQNQNQIQFKEENENQITTKKIRCKSDKVHKKTKY